MEENTNQINQEKLQIKNEKLLYEMTVNGKFDHKTDYDKGKEVLLLKKEYMPLSDKLSKNESDFIAKNYPEMIETFSLSFNWKQSSNEVVKWGGQENIKKYFDKIDLRQCADDLAKYESEFYEKIKNEVNRKIPIISALPVPKIQIKEIIQKLREKGFGDDDKIVENLEKLHNSKDNIYGQELLEKVSEIKDEDYINNVKYDYVRGLDIIKQCGLIYDTSSIDHIKVNDEQHLKLPFLGKKFDDLKEHLEDLLKGKQTKILEGFKIKDQGFDAKLQLLIDPESGKMIIKSQKRAEKLVIPEELSESEIQKLKNGERISLSRGFMHNYRTSRDRTSLLIRKITAAQKLKEANKLEEKSSMLLDKELNKLVINYIVKDEGSTNKEKVEAVIVENGDESPSIYLKGNTKTDKNNPESKKQSENINKVNEGIADVVKEIKKKQEENVKEKDVRNIIGFETKAETSKTISVKQNIK